VRPARIHGIDVRPGATTVALAVVALSVSVAVVGLLTLAHFDAPDTSAGIKTAITALGVVAAGFLVRCFMHSHLLSDLLLLVAVAAVSLTDFAFATAPALAGVDQPVAGTSARMAMQVLAAIAFAVAALAPERTVARHVERGVVLAGLVAIGTIATAELIDLLTGAGPIVGTLRPSEATATAHDALVQSALVGSSGALIVAAIAFGSRGLRGDGNAGLLAGASFLLAGACLASVSIPTVAVGWVTPRDGLRVSAYAVVLVVALRAYTQTRREAAETAVNAARERIARDLHDGLAQDLAIIAVHAQRLQCELGSEHALTLAARRALATARGTILDLSASAAPTTEAALREVAHELADRFSVQVNVEVEADAGWTSSGKLESSCREEVVRIAREAVVNAAVHGGAHRIEVALDHRGSALRLLVSDDGCGIGEGVLQSSHGFGLATMRARAEALGGRMTAGQRPEGGTVVEVLVR
jgi:signal transduction histidine kinase